MDLAQLSLKALNYCAEFHVLLDQETTAVSVHSVILVWYRTHLVMPFYLFVKQIKLEQVNLQLQIYILFIPRMLCARGHETK